MKKDSVFSRSRYEYEGSHLYFLDKNRLNQLEKSSPVIIYGSRGTGKTTLLNALNWQEQLRNHYLIKELGDEKKYENEYLGLYVKLAKINVAALSKWREEAAYPQLFAFYLDLVWLEQLTAAIGTLSAEQHIEISAIEERAACKEVADYYSALVKCSGARPKSIGFSDLSNIIRYARENVEGSALYGESAETVHRRFEISGQVGEVGRRISKMIHKIWLNKGMTSYKFKICLDECECLDPYQVKILSTIVRLSDHPAFFVYSFISLPVDFYSTLISNLYIAKSDIEHVSLDEMSDYEFERFAQGVVGVRLSAEGIIAEGGFSNEKIFGKLSINALIEKILKKSESKDAVSFIESSEKQSKNHFFDYYKNEGIPYYQSYLVGKLGIETEKHNKEEWPKSRRLQESKEIRKKMVAAYLSICNDFKSSPMYAGSEMIFQISDKSIRDYLWQLHEIFIEFGKPLDIFVNSEVPIEIQDKAIKTASANKMKSLPSSQITDPGKIYRIVCGLGSLTSLIQSRSADMSHLKSSERGLFRVEKGLTEHEIKLIRLIEEASEAGFLKITSSDQDQISFRVHASLSPNFEFSYRGAYYVTNLESRNIKDLTESAGEHDLIEKVRTIAKTLYNMEGYQIRMDGI